MMQTDSRKIDIEAVRLANPLSEVVAAAGVKLKRGTGREQWGCCPFHNEKTASFKIDTVRQSWFCFGACSEGGDVFSFIQRLEGVDFAGALKWLANRGGIADGFDPVLQEARKKAREKQIDVWQNEKQEEDAKRRASAFAFWQNASPAASTVVERYFEVRGLPADWVGRTGFRFNPKFWGDKTAMLAPITNPATGKFMAMHATFLRADGRGKQDANRQPGPKVIVGPYWGGWIKIGKDDGVSPLLLGEGIETTLTAMLAMKQAGKPVIGRVGVSLGNITRALAPAPPKQADRALILLADNDMKDMDAGREAYAQAAKRLRQSGW